MRFITLIIALTLVTSLNAQTPQGEVEHYTHERFIASAMYLFDKDIFVLADIKGNVEIRNADDVLLHEMQIDPPRTEQHFTRSVFALSPDKSRLARLINKYSIVDREQKSTHLRSMYTSSRIDVWDLEKAYQHIATIEITSAESTCTSLQWNGEMELITGHRRDGIQRFSVPDGKPLGWLYPKRWTLHEETFVKEKRILSEIRLIQGLKDGKSFLIAAEGGVYVYDTDAKLTARVHQFRLEDVFHLSEKECLVVGYLYSFDGLVKVFTVWSLESGKKLEEYQYPTLGNHYIKGAWKSELGTVHVGLTHSRSRLFGGPATEVWDITNGEQIFKRASHTFFPQTSARLIRDSLYKMQFSPSGEKALWLSNHGKLGWWILE